MPDTTYRVVLALETQGNLQAGIEKATGGLGKAHDHANKLQHALLMTAEVGERGLHKLGSMLEGIADSIMHVVSHAAVLGGGALFAGAAYGVTHLNNELEQTQISLGAIFSANGLARNFDRGFEIAGEQVAKMKQDVKTLPGDLGQLATIMKTISPSAAHGGLSPDQIRKLAGQTMLVGQIVGVDQEMAAREMAELLEGRATSRNKLATRIGLGGAAGKHLRSEDSKSRVNDIEEVLSHYQGATDRFAQSFIANWTTLKDNIKYGFLADATAPLFNSVKKTLAEINQWFDHNQDQVKMWAFAFGSYFRATWNLLTAELKQFGPALENMGHVFFNLWHRAIEKAKELEPLLLTVAKLLEHTSADGVIGAGKTALEMKFGGMGLNLAGDAVGGGATAYRLFSSWKMAKEIQAIRAAQAAGSAGEAAAAGTAAAAGEAGAGTAAAAAGAGAVGGGGIVAALGGIPGIGLLIGLGLTLGAGAGVAGNLGDRTKTDIEKARYREMFHMPLKEIAEAADATNDPLQSVIKNLKTISEFDWFLHLSKVPVGSAQVHPGTFSGDVRDDPAFADLLAKKPMPGGGGGTNIQKVEIIVKGSDDPSRVARLTLEHLNRIARNPTRSPSVPNWTR